MDEEVNKETKETPEKGAQKETESSSSLVDRAAEQADRLEAANKKQEELLERAEKLQALRELGGETSAGQAPEKPMELTPEEYKNKIMGGEIPDAK